MDAGFNFEYRMERLVYMPDEMTMDTPVDTESANESSTDNQQPGYSTESAKTSDNQEGQATETTETEQAVSTEPKPYSFEELQNVKNYTELDPSRLPKSLADAINASKSAQGELTKLQQRLAAQEKPQPQRPSDPQQAFAYDLFQAFDNEDYTSVTQRMNALNTSIERRKLEFAELQFTDPDKAAQLKQNILADIEFKSRLDNAMAVAYQNKSLNNTLYNDVDAEIFKAMPKFKELAPEIGSFALKEMNFDKTTIEDTMDAKVYIPGLMQKYGITQQEAAKRAKSYVFQLTKGMHDIYLRVSGKGIKDKENRTPNKTETKSSGYTHKSKTAKDMNDNEIEQEINRLKFGR